jgi:7-carboxy-7-deazaguanine synthase
MKYSVKEIFYTLQGEGANAGRPAVFCRFAGCNLWSGKERDRSTAICGFCDTAFVGTDGPGGGKFSAAQSLVQAIASLWPAHDFAKRSIPRPLVVCTGGEPLLQLDSELISALHNAGFEVAVETNGTILPPTGIDWICVSPKAGATLALRSGTELKLIFPQQGISPDQFDELNFQHYFLQPMDGPELAHNTRLALNYCLAHPWWRLSLQTHKFLGIP